MIYFCTFATEFEDLIYLGKFKEIEASKEAICINKDVLSRLSLGVSSCHMAGNIRSYPRQTVNSEDDYLIDINKSETENILTNTIFRIRDKYIIDEENEEVKTYRDINLGECKEFAHDVIDELGGESDELSGVNNRFFTQHDEEVPDWPYDCNGYLVDRHWGTIPPHSLIRGKLYSMCFGDHYMIVLNDKHYDAECPEGVLNMFDLPIFSRVIRKNILQME